MAKHKKKRNKIYTGEDAALTEPVVTRISAINRSKPKQWWFDNKKRVKTISIIVGVILLILVIIIEIVRIANGG